MACFWSEESFYEDRMIQFFHLRSIIFQFSIFFVWNILSRILHVFYVLWDVMMQMLWNENVHHENKKLKINVYNVLRTNFLWNTNQNFHFSVSSIFWKSIFMLIKQHHGNKQGLLQQFIACDYCTQSPALFQNIFKLYTFFPKFSIMLPFFALFLKNRSHAVTF